MSNRNKPALKDYSNTTINVNPRPQRPPGKSGVIPSASRVTIVRTPIYILKTLLSDLNLPEEFYNSLNNLSYRIDKKILILGSADKYDNGIIMEIAGLIRTNAAEYALNFLNNVNNPDNIFWDQPIFEIIKAKIENEINNDRTKVRGSVGVDKCKFCPSKEIVYKFGQTSSSDEGFTIFYTCVSCDRNWKSK